MTSLWVTSFLSFLNLMNLLMLCMYFVCLWALISSSYHLQVIQAKTTSSLPRRYPRIIWDSNSDFPIGQRCPPPACEFCRPEDDPQSPSTGQDSASSLCSRNRDDSNQSPSTVRLWLQLRASSVGCNLIVDTKPHLVWPCGWVWYTQHHSVNVTSSFINALCSPLSSLSLNKFRLCINFYVLRCYVVLN